MSNYDSYIDWLVYKENTIDMIESSLLHIMRKIHFWDAFSANSSLGFKMLCTCTTHHWTWILLQMTVIIAIAGVEDLTESQL